MDRHRVGSVKNSCAAYRRVQALVNFTQCLWAKASGERQAAPLNSAGVTQVGKQALVQTSPGTIPLSIETIRGKEGDEAKGAGSHAMHAAKGVSPPDMHLIDNANAEGEGMRKRQRRWA